MVETDPQQPENRPHQYNYNPTLDPNQDTVIAANKCSGEGEGPIPHPPAPVPPKSPEKGRVQGIRQDELVRLTPKLQPYLRHSTPAWPDIVDAADWLRHDLGIS